MKQHICTVCHRPSVIWKANPKRCKDCYYRELHSLKQTEDGKIAKPFKYQTKVIKKVSTRQQKLNAAYKALRDTFMKTHEVCQAQLDECTGKATECHHKAGRGQYLLDDTKFMALCNNCHIWINEHNEAATTLGFCQSRLSKTV